MIIPTVLEIIRLSLELSLEIIKGIPIEDRQKFWREHQDRVEFWQKFVDKVD